MISVNGSEIADHFSSLEEMLIELGFQRAGVAVAKNGELVHRSDWPSTVVCDGDSFDVLTASAGG